MNQLEDDSIQLPHEVQVQLKLAISQIIERSRHQEERFLVDTKSAAEKILVHLSKGNFLAFYQ